jgi:serine/threonine protein kinase/Tol biopolymer transport system component
MIPFLTTNAVFLMSLLFAVRFVLAALRLPRHDGWVQELTAGTLRGHYKIVRRLGQGGMGVVYEAEDQKLGRSVAIKLLPEATRQDPAALERFWREARTASSLNHPGICIIHELNESGDQPFIVMELLEGESLDKLYYRRPMAYPKLLDLGTQVADALDAAHRKGILHRDIKPGNIFLSPSGQVKILDFGLAKLEDGYSSPGAGNPNVTLAENDMLTSPGSAVGTIAYMSPEQARGESLDARSDVFSLGVVLYELSTGQHPFSGSTTAVTFDRILNYAPTAPIAINPDLPPELEETLNKTLEKDRELRLQSAAELRAELKRLQRKSSGGSVARPIATGGASASGTGSSPSGERNVSPPSGPSSAGAGSSGSLPAGSAQHEPAGAISAAAVAPLRAKKSRVLPIAVMVVVLLAAAGFAAWRLWPHPVPFTTVSLSQITNTGTLETIALSGDGKFLAEVKNDAGQRTLWVRNIATNTDSQILTAFANEYVGFNFSPDANYLYFTRGTPENAALHSLYVMPVFGGTPRQLIHDVDSAPSLSPDGSRLVYLRWTPDRKDHFSEIHSADKDGGDDQLLYTSFDQAQPPVWSPLGSQIAWIESSGPGVTAIKILDIASKKVASITQPDGIHYDPGFKGHTDMAWMPDGRHLIVLYSKSHSDRGQIGIVSVSDGAFHTLTNDVNAYSQLAISADGKTLATVLTNVDSSVAYYKGDGGAMISSTPLRITPTSLAWADEDHLWLITRDTGISKLDRASGTLQPIDTRDLDAGSFINACADGHVLFIAIPKGGGESRLFRMDGDGSGIIQMTTSGIARSPHCTPDSQKAYFAIRPKANIPSIALWSLPLAGGTPKKELELVSFPIGIALTRDMKSAMGFLNRDMGYFLQIWDVSTHQMLHQLAWDTSNLQGIIPGFSPDGKAVVSTIISKGSNALQYQPIDGSPTHLLTEPTHETQTGFAWSPSAGKLAVLQSRSSSDVVLITDLTGKQPH